MQIEITEEDIQKGNKQEENTCPIARAVRRTVGRQKVKVGTGNVTIKKDKFTMFLPKKARTFIHDFDSGQPVKPFTFVLRGYRRKNNDTSKLL